MKNPIFASISIAFLLVSCHYDLDDRNKGDLGGTNQDYQFTDENGNTYFTGILDCSGPGNFSFDDTNVLEDLEIPSSLPETMDLSSYLPPIGNQGRQGSCVSWATTYYLKSFQERLESGLPYDPTRIMSPSYTYNQITQGICEGTFINSALDILKETGTVSIESFPYFDNTCSAQPNEQQEIIAMANRISDYKYLSGENMVLEMKTLLHNNMPILISAFLTSKFGNIDTLGLTAYREHDVNDITTGGCHAMLVVGYSDAYEAFKVVNSWGENWGDNGFVWIDYKAFNNVLDGNYEFKVINSAIVAYDL